MKNLLPLGISVDYPLFKYAKLSNFGGQAGQAYGVHATASRERPPRVTRQCCDLRMNTRVDTDLRRVTRGGR